MDVIDTRADVAGVGLVNEDLEELSITLAVLDTEDISVKGGNGVEEVLEFGVAEVGVDLGAIRNAGGGEAEGLNCPFEVGITGSSSTERETLTESGLVDLDDEDTSSLKINNLVTESKGELLSLDRLVDIITGE